jgi:hypothetical protein
MLTVATNDKCPTCNGFSLGKTICFRSLEFIADCFGGLSLSPKWSDLDVVFMGTTRSGSQLLWSINVDSTEEFYMNSRDEGSSDLPASKRHGTGAPPAPIATTLGLEDASVTQAMTMVPLQALAPWPKTGLPLEQ